MSLVNKIKEMFSSPEASETAEKEIVKSAALQP